MNAKVWVSSFLALGFMFLFNFGVVGIAEASTNIDYEAIRNTDSNLSIDYLFGIATEYSVPILIGGIVLSGFMAVVGLVFKPLKMAAGGLFGTCIMFFILVNYAPEISGILISVVDGIMSRISGGA